MAVLTIDDFETSLKSRLQNDTSDEAIAALEDITDTIGDIRNRLSEDWKTKYEENDRTWREKYTARFFDDVSPEVNPEGSPENEEEVYDYESSKDEEQEKTYDSVEALLEGQKCFT